MKKAITNVSASILARLKNISEKDHVDYNFLLLRYMQERFLARLAVSNYVKKFVLKGGFLLLAYNVDKARATRDIDFLGVNVSINRKEPEQSIRDIVSISLNDGVVFLEDTIKSEEIKEEAEYSGVRINLTAKIGTARNSIQLDFGFGDVTSPKPFMMDYPAILSDERVTILAYSKETIVAEKFEAIVKLSTFNSRMKDFYDIVFLANEFDFDGVTLQSAIRNTFSQRQTSMATAAVVLTSDMGKQKRFQQLWDAFKKRTKISSDDVFTIVFTEIRHFLEPLVKAELTNSKTSSTWKSHIRSWIE